MQNLANLNDLLNDSETNRERAKAQIELIKATGAAIADSTPISALGGASSTAAANPAASAIAGNIGSSQLVTPARKLLNGIWTPMDLSQSICRKRCFILGEADDIVLVDGDIIKVPERPTTVQVIGAVNSERGILFDPGKRLDYYVDLAGGFTTDAAKDKSKSSIRAAASFLRNV